QDDVAPQQHDQGPEREERTEGQVVLSPAATDNDEGEPDQRAGEEPAEQPEHELAPAEPPEDEPEHERELHVAEAHAPRRQEMQRAERHRRDNAPENRSTERAPGVVAHRGESKE